MDKRINILFLVSKFDMGGVQKANISMINGIDKNKFNVHVLYILEGMLMDDLNVEDIKIIKIGNKLELKSIETIKYIGRVIKYIKKNNIEVVHTIDPMFYLVGATATKCTGIKHVRTQPNFIRRHEKLNTKTMKVLPFERWTDKFITYQYGSAKDLKLAGVGKDKITTIHNISKIEDFLYFNDTIDIKGELGIPIENKIILALHRMVELKGYETFISMIPYIVKEYKKVTFLLVGDGPLRQQFEEQVKTLGVEEYVIFTGFRKDLSNIVKQVDFGVYPLADTAAMFQLILAGKVLITKKNSSMDEYIVDGKTGFLVKDDTPESYAKYSLKLLEDDDLQEQMEKNQYQHVLDNFDGKKNIKRLENIFESLCRKDSGIDNKE